MEEKGQMNGNEQYIHSKKNISLRKRERERQKRDSQSEMRANRKGRWHENSCLLFWTEKKFSRENEEIFPGDSHLNVSDMHASVLDLTLARWKSRMGQIDVEQAYCTCQVRITTGSSLFFFDDSLNIKVSLARPLSAFSWRCFWFAFHLQGGIEDGKESIGVVSSFRLSSSFNGTNTNVTQRYYQR